jgi:ribosomal protein S18 acetylase RimI-like enzyme
VDEIVVMRPAVVEDIDFLWSMLFLASHADEQRGATAQTIQGDPDLAPYLSGWNTDAGIGLVAVRTGVRIGAAWLRPFRDQEAHLVTYVDDDTPELVIAVEPKSIGCGVGSLLLCALMEAADQAAIRGVVLTVRSDNPAARLYQRHGFVEVDQLVNRVGTRSLKMIRSRFTSDQY